MNFRQYPLPVEAPPRVYRVSEIVGEVSEVLRARWGDIRVAGEVSGLRRPGSGHLYFDLKDEAASVAAVMWRSDAAHLRFALEDGLEVVVRGCLCLYAARGQFQIQVVSLEPVGMGALQLAFEQMRKKLEAEGLFDPARKRPLPFLPQRIAVVTSPAGAAIRDVLRVLARRFENVRVTIFPSRVQGEGAAQELARAIRAANRWGSFEVLILARGGGSLEDLAPFNEEALARALARSRIPTISAVGHETDVTIADLVADLRASTPSAAAEMVVGAKGDIQRRVGNAGRILSGLARRRLAEARSRLASASRSESLLRFPYELRRLRLRLGAARRALAPAVRRRPLSLRRRIASATARLGGFARLAELARKRDRVGRFAEALARVIRRRLEGLRGRFEAGAGKLSTLDPLAILARGYAVAYREGSPRPLKDASRVRPGDAVRVRLHRGALRTRVLEVEPGAARPALPLFSEET